MKHEKLYKTIQEHNADNKTALFMVMLTSTAGIIVAVIWACNQAGF